YLNAKGALTYTDIAGDPVLYGNLPPREISMKDVFRSGDSSKKFKIAEGQWYRYAPSYVSPAYHLLEGFPDNQKEIAEMQNETQKEIAGIQSATSRQNTKDQVYAQNEMLAYQQKESTARVASIMENTNLSK